VGKNFAVENFTGYIYRDNPQQPSLHLTSCFKLRCRIQTRHLSQIWAGNTFDLNPKWARTLLLRILQDIFIETTPNNQVYIWHPAVHLRWRIPPRHLCQYLWPSANLTKKLCVLYRVGLEESFWGVRQHCHHKMQRKKPTQRTDITQCKESNLYTKDTDRTSKCILMSSYPL
jgi:hypothetical protein